MYENPQLTQLRTKLRLKQPRVWTRYEYYEMHHHSADLQISTPPKLRWMNIVLGWCSKAVDALSDRLVFREFRNDYLNMNEIFDANNKDIFFDSAVLSALIASCSFVYISQDEVTTDPTTGETVRPIPRLHVIDGSRATGVIDPTTNLLKYGYAILDTDEHGKPTREALFEPYRTTYIVNGEEDEIFEHPVPYPLLVPIIYRPDAKRPFGHSRISRTCMDIVDSAQRTMKRAEISAEFYAFPQKYVIGLSEDTDFDSARAYMSSFLNITADEEGGRPTIGQFQQQSMTPHTEQLKMWANAFAGETGLTLDDLGFPTTNPASADAIKAAHESLRLTARKAQRTFGYGFLNVGFLAACLHDGIAYDRSVVAYTMPVWEPVFEPDITALSQIGDALIKMQQAYPDYLGQTAIYDLTGIRPEAVAEGMTADAIEEMENGDQILETLLGGA